jgi:CheY-like chemotaxis protein
MDASLPRADGLCATRRIRERDQLRTIPIVFVSGYARPGDRDAAFAAGCNDYLVKPLDMHELDHVLEKRLKQWRCAH